MLLLVANALQPGMTGPGQSVLGGAIILATIFVLNRLVSEARIRIPFVRRVLEFKPTTIGREAPMARGRVCPPGFDLGDAEAWEVQSGLGWVQVEPGLCR